MNKNVYHNTIEKLTALSHCRVNIKTTQSTNDK